MIYYFKLQYLRFKRDLIVLGLNPLLGMGIFLFSFIGISELIFTKINYSWQLYLLIALLIISTFGEEIRNQFLKSVFPPIKFFKIRLIENLLAAVPFSIFLVLKNYYFISVLNIVLSCILSLHNKVGLTRFQIPSPFSKNPYEFTVGFRRTYLVILAIYTMTFISIYIHNFNLGLLSLLSIFLLCSTFYSELDPIYYVWIHSQCSEVFLRNKIKTALLYSLCLSLVILLPLIIFNFFRIGIVLLTGLIGLLYVVLGILAAYVNFPMRKTSSQNVQFYFGIFIPPLLLFIIPNMYYQANRRLKDYLKC